MRPVLTDFLKKIGVEVNVNKTGEFKDSGSTWRKQTKKDAEYLQEFIDDYYNRFLEIVSKNRNTDISKVKKLADGKIYWAPKAKEFGLIDEIGDIDTAIDYASKKYHSSKQTVIFQPKISIARKLFGNAASSIYEEISEKLLTDKINLK